MSPSQFRDENAASRDAANERRTSSHLKISKESHPIHKSPPSSSSSSSSAWSPLAAAAAAAVTIAPKQRQDHHPHGQQRHPVIIYTHSPKIIRTEARDFMALVQKLTGLSRSEDGPPPPRPPTADGRRPSSNEGNNSATVVVTSDDATSSSSSVLTDDQNCGINDPAQVNTSSNVISPVFDSNHNPFFSDIPIFTPNSSDFFCSPAPYRYPDAVFASPNVVGGTNSISPTVMDVLNLKTYQGY